MESDTHSVLPRTGIRWSTNRFHSQILKVGTDGLDLDEKSKEAAQSLTITVFTHTKSKNNSEMQTSIHIQTLRQENNSIYNQSRTLAIGLQ
jgi:hypothetical protein